MFQRRIAIRWTQIQQCRGLAPQHGVYAGLQFLDGKIFFRRTCHHERERIFRHIGREAAKNFFPAFIGEEQFPADSSVAVQDRWRRRRDLQSVAVSLDKRAASYVALNQTLRFQLGISIRHCCAVNAKHGGELTAGRNADARAQVALVNTRAQLVAKLDVQGNVTLLLEMEWKHCLSPSANSTRHWPGARANLSSAPPTHFSGQLTATRFPAVPLAEPRTISGGNAPGAHADQRTESTGQTVVAHSARSDPSPADRGVSDAHSACKKCAEICRTRD